MDIELSSWNSYPKIYNIGHAALSLFFTAPVQVQEKVDGSQLSFGVIDGELKIRSKNREFSIHGPDNLFANAAETVKELESKLRPGWTYRGEYLNKPKHNVLAYERTPERHIVLFDIATGGEGYLEYQALVQEAQRLGLEAIPQLAADVTLKTVEQINHLMETTSFLGGTKVEGLVFKRYSPLFDPKTAKPLIAKYVSEAFREKHKTDWRKRHPNVGTVKDQLVMELTTDARFEKAVQHLSEDGVLEGSPRDIGPLIREVTRDLEEEEKEYIQGRFYNHYIRDICRGVTRGLPQWYKQRLLKEQFDDGHQDSGCAPIGSLRLAQNAGIWLTAGDSQSGQEQTQTSDGGAVRGIEGE